MNKGILRAGLIVAGMGALMLPAGLEAQEGSAGASATAVQSGPTAAELTARIQAVQRQAMQDSKLSAANRELGALINATLPRVDPNYPSYATRAGTLKADEAAARAAGDNERLRELAEEAAQLQANVIAAQEKAKEDPAVKAKLEEFRVALFTKMVEIEPTVQDLVKQLEARQAANAASGSAS